VLPAKDEVLLMHRSSLLIVTAIVEVGTALFLLFLPSIPLALLLGVSEAAPEAVFIARIAGAALFAIGVTCWLARSDQHGPAQRGVLTGVLIYDLAAAALLAYAALVLRMAGIALWPAFVLHAGLAVWCIVCLWNKPHANEQLAS
jgi:Kef-type K+ transport system membrane component KefB